MGKNEKHFFESHGKQHGGRKGKQINPLTVCYQMINIICVRLQYLKLFNCIQTN